MIQSIQTIVHRLVRYYKTRSPYELAIARGYHVIYSSTLPERISGMFVPIGRRGVIFINTNVPSLRRPFIIAHELAHGVLRHEGERFTFQVDSHRLNWKRLSVQEKEAHLFSASLLLDELNFEDGMTIEQAAAITGCPPKIIEIWLHEQTKARHGFSF